MILHPAMDQTRWPPQASSFQPLVEFIAVSWISSMNARGPANLWGPHNDLFNSFMDLEAHALT